MESFVELYNSSGAQNAHQGLHSRIPEFMLEMGPGCLKSSDRNVVSDFT